MIINSPSGWLSTYAVTLMMLYMLIQEGEINHIPIEQVWPSQLPSFPEHVEAASPDLPKVARLFMRFLDFYGFGGKFQPHIHVVQLRLPASHGLALKTDRFYSRYEKKVSIAIEDVIEKDQWAAHINEKRWNSVREQFAIVAIKLRQCSARF